MNKHVEPVTTLPVRGRPRDADAGRRLIGAALKLLVELGYAAMSLEAVAAEAGVAKTTLYRRYNNKLDIVVAAIEQELQVATPPDSGSTKDDVEHLLHDAQKMFADGRGVQIASIMAFESAHHPELISAVRDRMILPRRAITRLVLQRGIARGEVRPDIDISVATDLIGGAIFGWFFSGRPISSGWSVALADLAWRSVASQP